MKGTMSSRNSVLIRAVSIAIVAMLSFAQTACAQQAELNHQIEQDPIDTGGWEFYRSAESCTAIVTNQTGSKLELVWNKGQDWTSVIVSDPRFTSVVSAQEYKIVQQFDRASGERADVAELEALGIIRNGTPGVMFVTDATEFIVQLAMGTSLSHSRNDRSVARFEIKQGRNVADSFDVCHQTLEP